MDPQGEPYVVNGVANLGLFEGLLPRLEKHGIRLQPELWRLVTGHRAGPVQLDELENLIRLLSGSGNKPE